MEEASKTAPRANTREEDDRNSLFFTLLSLLLFFFPASLLSFFFYVAHIFPSDFVRPSVLHWLAFSDKTGIFPLTRSDYTRPLLR